MMADAIKAATTTRTGRLRRAGRVYVKPKLAAGQRACLAGSSGRLTDKCFEAIIASLEKSRERIDGARLTGR